MKIWSIKPVLLSFVLASALPMLACNDDDDTPTSPTPQPGPPVSNPDPAPTPTPDPDPDPTPPDDDDDDIVTVTGNVSNLDRTGPNGLNIMFRINDSTMVRADADTPVTFGATTGNTSLLRFGQTVTAEGRLAEQTAPDERWLDATRIIITSQ